jgi:hypothetical protein
MMNNAQPYSHDDLQSFIIETFTSLREPYMAWADLARRAVQGYPFDGEKLIEIQSFINDRRSQLRQALILASEFFDDQQLIQLRNQARMSKSAWNSHKKPGEINLKNGFKLISY